MRVPRPGARIKGREAEVERERERVIFVPMYDEVRTAQKAI